VKILFYGRLGEMVGREVEVEAQRDCATVADLRQILARLYPHASDDLTSPRLRASVGDRIVGDEFSLGRRTTVEFFPPLSGG
jgi:molybdopterin converting factor small subunit